MFVDDPTNSYGSSVQVCLELLFSSIEHLEADVLEQLPKALFENLQPDIVVMTTPNSEFNVVFPDFEGFRHTDHKFEWTREEFQSW